MPVMDMRAIMVMFDSLKRDWLPPYQGDIIAPNFTRLAEHAVTFDNFYIGSMPCMPARRELHTGRYNFLHKGWSPLEPFDDSVPELLKNAGVHTHLVSDHHHYWRDGGANYHVRYTTNEHIRGQEGDPWKGVVNAQWENTCMSEDVPPMFQKMFVQDTVNRQYMDTEEKHSQTLVFNAGLEFIEKNREADNWFVTIENFDPHEPFFTYPEYKAQYPCKYHGRHVDWPMPATADQDADYIAYVQNQYKALVTQLDKNLGRVLDAMDRYDMWKDTLLIVNTDHGLLLGEHDWWSKGAMPAYNEIARLPFFIWDPRLGIKNARRSSLAQNIDVAATLLEFFGQPLPKDMEGRPLKGIIAGDIPNHSHILYGYFGGTANITDGKFCYLRGPVSPDNAPLYEYTLMPAQMGSRADVKDLQNVQLWEPFPFTKGCKTLQIDKSPHNSPFSNPYRYGSRLYDLENDPGQKYPMEDYETELQLVQKLMAMMQANSAPAEQYQRLGLWENIAAEDLKRQREAFLSTQKYIDILPDLNWSIPAVNQFNTLAALLRRPDITKDFERYAAENNMEEVTPAHIYSFAKAVMPREQAGMALMMLRLAERMD